METISLSLVTVLEGYVVVIERNVSTNMPCFSVQSGVFQYAVQGGSSAKVIGAFHGNFQEANIPPLSDGNITGYTMILSGGNDGQHGNQTFVESILNQGNAEWEISRWSDVDHGFTEWESDAYNLRADARSWDAFLTAMGDKMVAPTTVETKRCPSLRRQL